MTGLWEDLAVGWLVRARSAVVSRQRISGAREDAIGHGVAWRMCRMAAAAGVLLALLAPSVAEADSGSLYDMNVSENAHYGGAEPNVAVSTIDSRTLMEEYQGWTVITQQPPDPQDPRTTDTCWMAVSHDRGASWQRQVLPVTDTLRSACGDPVVVAGPHGIFYAGGDCFSGQTIVDVDDVGSVCVSSSSDDGRTWSRPSYVLTGPVTSLATCLAHLQVCGLPGVFSPYDRPYWSVDQSTGELFVSAVDHSDPDGGTATGVRYLTASHDHGRSFTAFVPIDSPEYPGGGSGDVSAARGVLGAAYVASAAPFATCPCLVFETTSDDGYTFHRHLVPVAPAHAISGSGGAWVAADPSRPGRFAVMALEASGTALEVYVTTDAGQSWRGPAVLGDGPPNMRIKPWLAYGPTGVLGALWKTQYPDSSLDTWVAVAPYGATGFGRPVRLSSGRSPGEPAFDDISGVTLDGRYLHGAWGDERGGVEQAWYGRYRFPAP